MVKRAALTAVCAATIGFGSGLARAASGPLGAGLLSPGGSLGSPAGEGGGAPIREVYAQKAGGKAAAMRRLKAIFREEATVRETQEWALHYYRLEPDRINGQASAARAKGLVPDIQASLSNAAGNTYTNLKDGLYPNLPLGIDGSFCNNGAGPGCGYKEITNQTNSQLDWSVSASWGLDKLVFNAEELDARSTVSLEETLVREVTTLYFSRRRLIANLVLSPPEGEDEAYYEQLRIEEMTATLDAFTNAEFGKKAYKGDFSASPQ